MVTIVYYRIYTLATYELSTYELSIEEPETMGRVAILHDTPDVLRPTRVHCVR